MRKFLLSVLLIQTAALAQQEPANDLATRLQPFVDCFNGTDTAFAIKGEGVIAIKGDAQPVTFEMARDGEHALSLSIEHPDYAARLDRTADMTRLYLPKHQTAIVGQGASPQQDSLAPLGLASRLISRDSTINAYIGILTSKNAGVAAMMLGTVGNLKPQADGTWASAGDRPVVLRFPDDRSMELTLEGNRVRVQIVELADVARAEQAAGADVKVQNVDRAELERMLVRGTARVTEILAPSGRLLAPLRQERVVANGKLSWVEDQRLVVLSGTPQQIGEAHGTLLASEARRCMDSILYSVGIAKTVESGRWFLNDLREAWKRLAPHIPEDHKAEMTAMAAAMGIGAEEAELGNVFPELFHCSGFALWGSATAGGKLYHGRVLDYMTMIGLQDAATTFIIKPDGKHAFATIGYAGFIGTVSGMNGQQISLGEMGGRGEGKWDGVPMATLMRRALEECSTLDEVMKLWSDSPRTCEYYYVFADGKIPSAVGVAATPEAIEFIKPGDAHELLGDGINDAVVLSAGDRLATLRQRVQDSYGSVDEERAMWLMSRPVSMKSNLHNVLFVPQDGVFYVANADHKRPAAERHYVRFDVKQLLEE